MSNYIGFQCDYSDQGTLEVTMQVPIKDKKGAGGKKPKTTGSSPATDVKFEEIKVLVPLWLPIVKDKDDQEVTQPGTYFVSCRTNSMGFEIFIEKSEFEKRVPKKYPGENNIYDKDYEASKVNDALDCDGYDEDGLKIGESGARAWPRGEFVPRTKLDPIPRYYAQVAIWQSIITTSTTAGSSRLWKPTTWNDKPLEIWFAPSEAWLAIEDQDQEAEDQGTGTPVSLVKSSKPKKISRLEKICDAIRKEEKKKELSQTSRRLNLTTWLKWDVLKDVDKIDELVLLSTDLLRHYQTYISKADLKRLIYAQTQGGANWKRDWPNQDEAGNVHAEILANLQKTNPIHYQLISRGLKEISVARISSEKTFAARVDAKKIMGSKSANQLGRDWWKSGDIPKVVAEWLHRSAYSLGPLDGLDFQSPDNIASALTVFGTFEANSDMTRAETTIRTLRDVTGADGTLATTVINKNLANTDQDQLRWLNPTTGEAEPWETENWIADKNYTWIAPNLIYEGVVNFPSPALPKPWTKRFQPFSRYSPLILEGKMDTRVLSAYLTAHGLKGGKISRKRSKPGPASTSIASTTSYAPLLFTSPELAMAMPPVHLSHSAMFFAAPGEAPLVASSFHSLEPPPATSRRPISVRDHAPGTVVVHPRTHTAWRSIHKQSQHVTLGDVRVEQPHLADDGHDIDESTMLPPSTGFMLEGTIKLFGLDTHKIELQSWHGPPPPDIDVGTDVPIYQRVQISNLRPADIIPLVEGSSLSVLEFQNVTVTYQNYQFVKTLPVGWTISGELVIDKRYGKLYDVLHNILKIPDDGLRLSILVSLGAMLQVHPNDINNNALSGIHLCDDVVLTRIGVLLFGISTPSGMNDKQVTKCGFRIFGDMHIKVPGSVTPLELDFEMGEFGGAVTLEAAVKGDVWKNAFGVGIDLDVVRLSAAFDASSPLQSLDCSLSAHLRADSISALVVGKYKSTNDYSVSAYVQDLGCEGVADLYRHHTGEELLIPTHVDITVGSASIEISKANGLIIKVEKLEFDHYSSVDALLKLSSTGVQIQASLKDFELHPGDLAVTLTSAYMRVSFEKEGSGRSSDVSIGGQVKLAGISVPAISAGVHLYKTSSSEHLEWTVYGTFTDLGNKTTLGKLFPQVKGTFLEDFALEDLMFIAASKDDPSISDLNPQKYPIKKGVQFSALFGQVAPLNKLLRRPSFPGLLLSAAWESGETFILDVVLPTNTLIHLGHGIATDPITLSINTKQLLLEISTGVKVPVPKSTTPLDFQASLTIKGESVALDGQMHGLWEDPFGISKSVSIGPFLELGLGIDLAIFPETGLPTNFSFAGGLSIGETEGQVAVQVSDNPSQELLSGEIKRFGIQDLVKFTRAVTEVDIPMVPDFIDFQDIKLYISTGVTLGTETYPAGFSFSAALLLFGAEIRVSAEVTGGVFKASGSVDNLHIGNLLRITGQHGKDATIDLELGSTTQKLDVDGAIEFLGSYIGLTLELEIMPHPSFSFEFVLHFTSLLTFTVEAQMIGETANLKDLSGLNFSLHAIFEQHLVEHVRDQVVASLEALKHRTDEAIHAAEEKVQQEEQKLQDGINDARKRLKKTYDSWIQHSNKVHADSQAFIDNYTKQLHALQGKVDNERQAFNLKLKNAEGAVQHANADRAAKMRAAEAAVTKAKSKWDQDVKTEEAKLESAKNYMHQKFGSAEEDIEAAKRKVDGVQSDIDSTNDRIRYCENAHWYRFECVFSINSIVVSLIIPSLKAELAYLGPKLLVLEGYKATADGILTLAEDVVKGVDYINAKAAIPAAEALVESVGHAGDLAFRAAQATLREVDRDTAAILNGANDVLKTVQKGGDGLLRAAEAALEGFITVQKDLLYAAQHAVEGLIHSAEWLAYQTASGALDLAGHATHALDVAKLALETAKKVADGTITVTEDVIVAALSAFDVTRIELGTRLDIFLGGSGGFHFEVDVDVEIVGQKHSFSLHLDMENPVKLIDDLFQEVIKKL
ncbi:hypothetical protein RhiJN_18296 [Ceratobasidium sp. AG-Ba]|nr:hypothetical protein RhiJN_18296 [Ceratobasidium sp. AG-Ba]